MSIKGTDFTLNQEKLEKEYMVVEVNEWMDYETKEKFGFNYVVLFPKLQYEKVRVSVKGNTPIITQEELKSKGQVAVVFDGLKTWASNYQNRWSLKAEANSVQRVAIK